jgi:hypothetical protein
MEFTSQICTSRDQSERLLALGLKRETADCILVENAFKKNNYLIFPIADIDETLENEMSSEPIPAWSLNRLIVLSGMGIIETTTDNIYDKVIQYIEFLIKCEDFNKEYLEE